MPRVLIIETHAPSAGSAAHALGPAGYAIEVASSVDEGVRLAGDADVDLVLLDAGLPGSAVGEAIARLRSAPSRPEVVLLTDANDDHAAEFAMRSGAWCHVSRPCPPAALLLPVRRALEFHAERRLRRSAALFWRNGIIGTSPAMRHCLVQLSAAAAHDGPVLFTGEPGTGKKLFARTLHENSARRDGELVTVACGEVPAATIEQLLSIEGPPAAVDRQADLLFRRARRGALVVDGVEQLTAVAQDALWKRISGAGRSSGGEHSVRLLAATDRDLGALAGAGRFLPELAQALLTTHVALPPLRERRGDIFDLVVHFVAASCRRLGGPLRGLTPEFLDRVEQYEWPGNVEALRQVVERALAATRGAPMLDVPHLVEAMKADGGERHRTGQPLPSFRSHRHAVLIAAEQRYLGDLMLRARGNIPRACELSSLSRPRLYALLSKHRIQRQRHDDAH